MHLYWGYACRRNYSAMDNILKIIIFQILPFFLHAQCALRYALQWILCVTYIYVFLTPCMSQ